MTQLILLSELIYTGEASDDLNLMAHPFCPAVRWKTHCNIFTIKSSLITLQPCKGAFCLSSSAKLNASTRKYKWLCHLCLCIQCVSLSKTLQAFLKSGLNYRISVDDRIEIQLKDGRASDSCCCLTPLWSQPLSSCQACWNGKCLILERNSPLSHSSEPPLTQHEHQQGLKELHDCTSQQWGHTKNTNSAELDVRFSSV